MFLLIGTYDRIDRNFRCHRQLTMIKYTVWWLVQALGARSSIHDCEWSEGIVAGPVSSDNFFEWDCYIMGPIDTPYEYGCFHAKLSFPSDYPMSPVSLTKTT